MIFEDNLSHNPYRESSQGIFLKQLDSLGNNTIYIIDGIDLYYHPVLPAETAFTFFLIRITLVIVGECFNIKVFKLMIKENGLVKNITSVLVLVQMVFWPCWLVLVTVTDLIISPNKAIGNWFCHVANFLFYFLGNVITFHSFIIAVMRYIFIIHNEKIQRFGIEKMKKIFLILTVTVPLLVAMWKVIEAAELDTMSFINKCYGIHHQTFLVETSTLDVFKQNFCQFEEYGQGGSYERVVTLIRQGSCIASKSVMLITGLNISEGIIYIMLLSHMMRYSQSQRNLIIIAFYIEYILF